MRDERHQQVRQFFLAFAEREAKHASPLYAALSRSIAEDPELCALAGQAGAGQPIPNLLFGAVHNLLSAQDNVSPLADYYPDLTPSAGPPADACPRFRTFCQEHAAAIREILATRRVQTNEVRRSAILLPGVARVLATAKSRLPLGLIEIGASAGLNLLFDRWQYRYGDAPVWGQARAPIALHCGLRGDAFPPLPPEPPLPIATRVGLDLNPIDLSDPDSVRWLRALIWPEQSERFALLDAAVAAARTAPPTLLGGNALETLPGALRGMPEEAMPCVFHSFTVNQFSGEMRETLEAVLQAEAERRGVPLHRLSLEGAASEPYPLLRHLQYRPGQEREATLLARFDPHGAWLEWLADS